MVLDVETCKIYMITASLSQSAQLEAQATKMLAEHSKRWLNH
jgi:hypothetical protein